MTVESRQINVVQAKANRATKIKVLNEFRNYAITQKDKKQLKAVSRYFFINKVLKKTLNALRMNAMESKFTGFYG